MYVTHLTLIVPALISFIGTLLALLFVRSYMVESGIVFVNLNPDTRRKTMLPTAGGVAVAFGFTIGMLAYVFGDSFGLYSAVASLSFLFATVLSVILITGVGFLDELNIKSTMVETTGMKDIRKGLKQWQKPLFTVIGAIPLMAVNAGVTTVMLPIVGAVNFGLWYPLVLLPLAVIFVANAFNLLGGFDGLITGTGLIAALGMLAYSLMYGTYTGALISAILVASVIPLFWYHKYPIKILPGDSFTYGFGAAFVAAAVVGNMESFGLVVFLPWIIEFFLHAMGRFKTTDLGKPQKDGTLAPPYGKKIYSWTHIMMNIKPMKEWEVSAYMWVVEILFVAFAFLLKFTGLL